MLRELYSDNRELTRFLRATHEICESTTMSRRPA
jgi:hypothetical protein